eukprot:1161580-Pelagomonas_calceolata.AAC.12
MNISYTHAHIHTRAFGSATTANLAKAQWISQMPRMFEYLTHTHTLGPGQPALMAALMLITASGVLFSSWKLHNTL